MKSHPFPRCLCRRLGLHLEEHLTATRQRILHKCLDLKSSKGGGCVISDVYTRNGDVIVCVRKCVSREQQPGKSVRFRAAQAQPRTKFGLMVAAATATGSEEGLERLVVVTEAQYEALLKRTRAAEGGNEES